ncbi:MAG: Rid family hydrolase [Bacteroidetes bacterium]|nr:Rid family hydrolase [Bacteroidota bacterium]MDA0930219.1 Rid family hydrolase [Bacteroidota bacterium]
MSIIESQRAPEPVGAYPHARKVGDFIFYSGMGPRARGKKEIPGVTVDESGQILSYDIEAQCHSVFQNLQAVVQESGASWMDVVDITVFLTNMKADFPTYNRIYAEYFKENQPCRTTLEILSLPTPIAIEVKAVAYVGKK